MKIILFEKIEVQQVCVLLFVYQVLEAVDLSPVLFLDCTLKSLNIFHTFQLILDCRPSEASLTGFWSLVSFLCSLLVCALLLTLGTRPL